MREYFLLFLKGFGMGAANVIPGVSGGTIALVTGIYEELISSVKSFNFTAIKLLFSGQLKQFSKHINLNFLIAVFFGVGISIISLAKLLEYLFKLNDLLVWSFFFGLIVASIFFVGRLVNKWNTITISTLLIGISIAVGIAFLKPSDENTEIWYLCLCGVVAVASMILPGLSGSYVLILMGNYKIIMLTSVSNPLENLDILIPVIIGAMLGFLILSHGISFVLKRFYDATISLLTGFIIGSLFVIWPWKVPAETISGKVVSYKWLLPDFTESQNIYAIGLIIFGFITVWGIEKIGSSISLNSK
jgi:putative membrane protein